MPPAGSERDAAAAVDARAADAVVAAADGRHRTDEPTDDVAQARIRSDRAAAARLRLMAVHAHPDDESSKGAATLAKYSAAGVGAMVVSCTGGERGEILNPKFLATDEEMAEIRRREMARAASILGIDHVWLGFVDSGWHEGPRGEWELPPGSFADLPPAVEVEALVRVVRRFRPQVMTTYDENGGYPHPDHLRCHLISVAAFEAAADPEAFPDAGEPWQVLKLYYNGGFSRARITAINEAVRARTGEGPFDDWIGRFNDSDRPDASERVTTRIPVADFYWARDAALRAHETQIDPDSHWFAIPHDLEAEVWGTDDYELARSLVDTAVPEDDLFAGIRERVGP
jgi:mycothiol S-conjugate amidase